MARNEEESACAKSDGASGTPQLLANVTLRTGFSPVWKKLPLVGLETVMLAVRPAV